MRSVCSPAYAGHLGQRLCLPAFVKEGPSVVQIVRNIVRNDFITQVKFLPHDSPQDALDKEMLITQKSLKRYEAERIAGIYDFAVLRAIVQVHAHSQKAEKDLKILRNALSYEEQQKPSGGNLRNSEQSSFAINVSSRLSWEKAGVLSASRFPARRPISFSTTEFALTTAGTVT